MSNTGDHKTEKRRTIKIMNPTSNLPTNTSIQQSGRIAVPEHHGAASERGASGSESEETAGASKPSIHRKDAGKAGVEFSLSRKSTDRRSSNPDGMDSTRIELVAIRTLYDQLQTQKVSAKSGGGLHSGIKDIKSRILALARELASKESSISQPEEDDADNVDELEATQAVLTELEKCVNALQGKAGSLEARKSELEKVVVRYEEKISAAKEREKYKEAQRKLAGVKKAKARDEAEEHNVTQFLNRGGELSAAHLNLGIQEYEVKYLTEQLNQRGGDISLLEEELKKMTTEVAAAEAARDAAISEKKAAQREITHLQSKISELKNDLRTQNKRHEEDVQKAKLAAEKSKLEVKRAAKLEAHDEYQEKLKELGQTVVTLMAQQDAPDIEKLKDVTRGLAKLVNEQSQNSNAAIQKLQEGNQQLKDLLNNILGGINELAEKIEGDGDFPQAKIVKELRNIMS